MHAEIHTPTSRPDLGAKADADVRKELSDDLFCFASSLARALALESQLNSQIASDTEARRQFVEGI